MESDVKITLSAEAADWLVLKMFEVKQDAASLGGEDNVMATLVDGALQDAGVRCDAER